MTELPLYAWIKLIHISAVVLSGAGFAARWWGTMRGSAWLRLPWVRRAPHGLDTVLLLSAISLAYLARLNPVVTPWLACKLAALVVYVLLGMQALRRGQSQRQTLLAGAAALAVFAFIVSVVVSKSPWGYMAWAWR